ncbi:hypothetical protein LOOC260_112850 [Paucilactobacillus hokkaidonensis JCM 18461]|uniref:DUF2187 domain-containing protein n=2 Tax=Paucilactobacillus hokkaidonensis TaxID=1193095 RepID=A0A0A1GU78_9LACO|nr:DUF2187 family protein [Paucilactobacillus hokkaidonensis]KRO10366.1 hypothetical protein IV59_GL001986 [Paucilactobacillus hokkaidonensis]BAP85822.1 hypothetical protein LOOC260_112850 [Paucilactobacillus hokkaidonensis JCM 18461]
MNNGNDNEEEVEEKFKIGDTLTCKKFGSLEHDFTGEIEKVYENSVLVNITEFDDEDQMAVSELNKRAIVRKSEIEIIE